MFKLLATSLVSLTALVGSSVLFSSAPSLRSAPEDVQFQDGSISGRVLDAQGHPITTLMVLAERTDVIIRPTPRAWTNKDGEFTIQGLPPGLYTLYTRKDEDGYPHTALNFYDQGESVQLRVQVFARQTTLNVIIQRGLKAAVLEGRVVDGTTNEPVNEADIMVRRVDQPERFLGTGLFWHGVKGGFKILVPTLPFSLKVSKVGYMDWYYKVAGEKAQSSPLLLAPGATKELFVRLRPSKRVKLH